MRKRFQGVILTGFILAVFQPAISDAQNFSSGPEKARIIFNQQGGKTGTLLLKHQKLAPGKGKYVLKKNQNIYHILKVGAVCGQGFSLRQISYKLESEQVAQVLYSNNNPNGPRAHTDTFKIMVFKENNLLNAVRETMGGYWYNGFPKEERSRSKMASLSQKIKITRFCKKPNGALVKVSKVRKIKVKKLKIIDLDY